MRTRFFPLLITIILFCITSLIAGETNNPKMNDYDVQHYDLSAAFDIPNKTINGSVIVEAKALSLSKNAFCVPHTI